MLLLLFPPAAAQVRDPVAMRVVRGNIVYAEERRAQIQPRLAKVPLEVEIDLPPLREDEKVTITLHNSAQGHRAQGMRVRIGGDRLLLERRCGKAGAPFRRKDKALSIVLASAAGGCGAQKLLLRHQGFDFRVDAENGAFYISVLFSDSAAQVTKLKGVSFAPAYVLDAQAPLRLLARRDVVNIASGDADLRHGAIFTLSGVVKLNKQARLAFEDTSARSEITDVKLRIQLSGALDFLAIDARRRKRKLTLVSTTRGILPVEFAQQGAMYTATGIKRREAGEVFSVMLVDDSDTAYSSGFVYAKAQWYLDRSTKDGLAFDTGTEILAEAKEAVAITEHAFPEAVRLVEEDVAERLAREAVMAQSRVPIEIHIPLPQSSYRVLRFALFAGPSKADGARLRPNGTDLRLIGPDPGCAPMALWSQDGAGRIEAEVDLDGCAGKTLRLIYDGWDASTWYAVGPPDATASCSSAPDATASCSSDPDATASCSLDSDAMASCSSDPDVTAPCSSDPDAMASCSSDPDAMASFTFEMTDEQSSLFRRYDLSLALPVDAYRLEAFELMPIPPEQNKNALFDFNAKAYVDINARLERQNVQQRARFEDITYDFSLSGDISRLFSTAAPTPYLQWTDARGAKMRRVLIFDGNTAQARITVKSADRIFVVLYADTHHYSAQKDSILRLAVTPALRSGLKDPAFARSETIHSELKLSKMLAAESVASFVMPWVYESAALPGQGDAMVTTRLRLSNLTSKVIGPVRVAVVDSSVAGMRVDTPAVLFAMITPYTSVEVTGEMLTDALTDFGQATLVLTIDGATPRDITLRRFTDVGGDVYVDSFGTAGSFNEFNTGQ